MPAERAGLYLAVVEGNRPRSDGDIPPITVHPCTLGSGRNATVRQMDNPGPYGNVAPTRSVCCRGDRTIGTTKLLLDLESERPGFAGAATLGGDGRPLRQVGHARLGYDATPWAPPFGRSAEAALLARERERIRRRDRYCLALPRSTGAADL